MTETELIRQCQQGDLTAFKSLYDLYHQPALRIALHMLGHPQDAEDAVQILFVKLHKSIGQFRFKAKFSTYVFQILRRICFDEIHRRKIRRIAPLDRVKVGHEPNWDQKLNLESAISRLPERMRLCFVLFAVEEQKQEEIAKIMGLSLGGVKSTLYHARTRLRQMLDDQPEK